MSSEPVESMNSWYLLQLSDAAGSGQSYLPFNRQERLMEIPYRRSVARRIQFFEGYGRVCRIAVGIAVHDHQLAEAPIFVLFMIQVAVPKG
jgi:hypothetical protein